MSRKTIGGMAVAICVCCSPASATVLLPGMGNVTFSAYTGGGTLVDQSYTKATTTTFTGSIREAVYRTMAGTYDFLYQLSNLGPGSGVNGMPDQTTIERMSAFSFDGFAIDAQVSAVAFGPFDAVNKANDATASRKADGTVSVNFPEFDGVAPGQTSAIYAFRTNATSYIPGTAQLIDGSTLDAAKAFAPGAVPEAASWVMMVLGFGAVGQVMRRRPSAGAWQLR